MTGPALLEGLAQPDQRSCGASVLVAARMLLDPAYAELVETGRHPVTGFGLAGESAIGRFHHEVLRMHERVTGPVDLAGRLQLPWPRALGTPPWALARQLSATGSRAVPAAPYSVRLARRAGGEVFDRLVAVTGRHRAVPVYVGDRWLPRHVVLVLGPVAGRLRCYDPARGVLVDVERRAFSDGRLDLAGWDRPWFVVLPR